MAFRVLDQSPQFFTADGSALLVGGSVTFYASGTSSLQDTFTDPSCTTANNNPLIINSQGRVADIWGNSNYRMIVKDALGAIQWTEDNVLGPVALPAVAGKSGQFLSNDGANPLWSPVAVLPDVTGQAGNMLVNNGTAAYWTPQPVPPTPPPPANVSVTSSTFTAAPGSGDRFFLQTGTGTIAPSGTTTAQVTITFPTPFKLCFGAFPTVTTTGGSILGPPTIGCINPGPTGFTAYASVSAHAGGTGGDNHITASVPFAWVAFGTLAAP